MPRRVFHDGNLETYFLPGYYDRREVDARRKRSINDDNEDKLHLVLPFNGIEHHVELTPFHDFISPEMVIEIRGKGIGSDLNKGLQFKRVSDHQCHYRGTVRGQKSSRAALSLCDGVVSIQLTIFFPKISIQKKKVKLQAYVLLGFEIQIQNEIANTVCYWQ